MKTLRFNFCHPIKGFANLIALMPGSLQQPGISFDSKEGNLVEIPLNNCQPGKWKVVLNWEYEDELYVHQGEFEVR